VVHRDDKTYLPSKEISQHRSKEIPKKEAKLMVARKQKEKSEFDVFNLDFDLSATGEDFDLDLTFDNDFLNQHENRYINPKPHKEIPEQNLYFNNALKLAEQLEIHKNQIAHVIVSGNFIFGDFLEAFFLAKDIQTKKLSISTLSMSEGNVDSLANLIEWNRVKELEVIISDYFFAHERRSMIPYMLKELDRNDTFQLAIAASHTKICLFETQRGLKMVMHGSANLRSANCTEQFMIEENSELFDFYTEYHTRIIDEYKLINKSVRGEKLWQAVATKEREEQTSVEPPEPKAGGPKRKSAITKRPTQDRKHHFNN